MSNNSRGELCGTFPPQHSPSAETMQQLQPVNNHSTKKNYLYLSYNVRSTCLINEYLFKLLLDPS